MAPATYLEADLKRYVALIGERAGKSEGANLLGANMEGPYLSAALDFGAMAEIICDGLHVTPSVVRAAERNSVRRSSYAPR